MYSYYSHLIHWIHFKKNVLMNIKQKYFIIWCIPKTKIILIKHIKNVFIFKGSNATTTQ